MSQKNSRRGFTLIEVIVSLASASVLTTGLGAALYLALSSADGSANQSIVTAGDALRSISSDIQFAQTISEQTATSITIQVPDRDGDNLAETIRYSWSGTVGDPLFREYNLGTAEQLVSSVAAFQLTYVQRGSSGVDYVTVRLITNSSRQTKMETGITTENLN